MVSLQVLTRAAVVVGPGKNTGETLSSGGDDGEQADVNG